MDHHKVFEKDKEYPVKIRMHNVINQQQTYNQLIVVIVPNDHPVQSCRDFYMLKCMATILQYLVRILGHCCFRVYV